MNIIHNTKIYVNESNYENQLLKSINTRSNYLDNNDIKNINNKIKQKELMLFLGNDISESLIFENYKLINTERINKNDTITIKWFSIWKDFCYELFTDILKYNIVNRSFTGDVHTQPYLYKLHMIFNEFNILSKLISDDADHCSDIFCEYSL